MYHHLNTNYSLALKLNRTMPQYFWLIIACMAFTFMNSSSQAADQLVLKNGKELSGKLVSLDSKAIVFKTAKGTEKFARTNILKLTLQKKRKGHEISKVENLPDRWLSSQLKSVDRKQTSESGIIVLRKKKTYTLTSPGLWSEEQLLTLFITKTPTQPIQNAIFYTADTESAYIDHIWYISPTGDVAHLNEADILRTSVENKLISHHIIGYQLTPPQAGTIIDIKLIKKHLKESPFSNFQALIQADSISTIEVISPAEKKWSIEHHINDAKKRIKYSYEVRGKELFQTWQIIPELKKESATATLAITVKDRFSGEVIDGYSEFINKKIGKIKVISKAKPTAEKLANLCHKFAANIPKLIQSKPLPLKDQTALSHLIEIELAQKLIKELLANGFQAELLLLQSATKEAYGKLFNITWYTRPLISCKLDHTYYLSPFSSNYYFPELATEFRNQTALCIYGKDHGKAVRTPAKNFFNEKSVIELTINEILSDQTANTTAIIDFNGRTNKTIYKIAKLPLQAQKKEMTSFLRQYYPGATLINYAFLKTLPNHSKIKLEFILPGFASIKDNKFLLCSFKSLPFTKESE